MTKTVQSAVSILDSLSAKGGLSLSSQPLLIKKVKSSASLNKVSTSDFGFHNWYRFVLSFPPHLVQEYLERFELPLGATVLDPFCGTGTTLVEAKLNGLRAVGIEANAVAHFASSTKLSWSIDPLVILEDAYKVAEFANKQLASAKTLRALEEDKQKLLIKNSICPVPLHKILILQEAILSLSSKNSLEYLRLALAKTLVLSASNLHFGPEVGVRGRKSDAPVIESWIENIKIICSDLEKSTPMAPEASVFFEDARNMGGVLQLESIDAVFTSPPYPNEKDYTRTTRLESVILGYINSKEELRKVKRGLLRSNTRGVYKGDDDDIWVSDNLAVNKIAEEIERRRIELNKNSGFEKLYSRVTKLYFGGMARHLAELRPYLKKGAMLGYVVGDQASYLQVMIRTGELLAEIAESLGYEVVGIDLFRTRISTTTKAYMREEVVVLKWNG